VGQVLDVPVYLHPSWFVITALITALYTSRYSALGLPQLSSGGALLAGLAAAASLLISVFLHELAHAAVARRVGTPPTYITLDLWGGHTGFSAEPLTPGRSAAVSLVGPASNAALALVGWLLRDGAFATSLVLGLLVYNFYITNLFVAIFNALPGLPLDGGRALEALVWQLTGSRTKGLLAAGWCGRIVAIAVVVWSIGLPLAQGRTPSLTGSIWLFLIALMLWRGASAAITQAGWRHRTETIQLVQLMDPAITVSHEVTVAQALDALRATSVDQTHGRPVVVLTDAAGVATAVLDEPSAEAVPVERRALVAATAVSLAVPSSATLPRAAAGADLLARLQADPQPQYVVVGDHGVVVGVLRWQTVADRVGSV
jgi:Zn-dependent protease